jgi:quaternary ammonium compound-resistance protein SugE
VELLFVTIGGVLLGLAARYSLPHRHLHGSVLVPALGGVVAAVLWVALTWAGLPWDGGLIWVLALVLTAIAVVVADVLLGRNRAQRDDAALEAMLAGRVSTQ